MNITEAIEQLQALRAAHGDLPLGVLHPEGSGTWKPVDGVQVFESRLAEAGEVELDAPELGNRFVGLFYMLP